MGFLCWTLCNYAGLKVFLTHKDNTQIVSSLMVKLPELFHELMFWRFSRKHMFWLIFDAFRCPSWFHGFILYSWAGALVMVFCGPWRVKDTAYRDWRGKALHWGQTTPANPLCPAISQLGFRQVKCEDSSVRQTYEMHSVFLIWVFTDLQLSLKWMDKRIALYVKKKPVNIYLTHTPKCILHLVVILKQVRQH